MRSNLNLEYEPGVLVRHPDRPEWGVGQVQSVIDIKITVNFEHAGKQVINGERVTLTIIKPDPKGR